MYILTELQKKKKEQKKIQKHRLTLTTSLRILKKPKTKSHCREGTAPMWAKISLILIRQTGS